MKTTKFISAKYHELLLKHQEIEAVNNDLQCENKLLIS
jgi:hypothetical protein